MIRIGFRWLERGSCRHPQAATIKGGSLCAVDFPAMVGVIAHPALGNLLFDTGYDPAFLDATRPFPERLYRWATPVEVGAGEEWQAWLMRHSIAPDTLAGLIVSHFHGDHVAGAARLAGLPLYCARAGLLALRSGSRFGRVRQGLLPALVPQAMDAQARFFEDAAQRALPSAFVPFTSGRDILGDGSLLAVELPGHCPGHWGLAFVNEDDRPILLAGDAVWSDRSIAENRPPPRLTTAILGNTPLYRATLEQLHQASCNGSGVAILPSHCARSAAVFNAGDAD